MPGTVSHELARRASEAEARVAAFEKAIWDAYVRWTPVPMPSGGYFTISKSSWEAIIALLPKEPSR